jgi:hypothetical protein
MMHWLNLLYSSKTGHAHRPQLPIYLSVLLPRAILPAKPIPLERLGAVNTDYGLLVKQFTISLD